MSYKLNRMHSLFLRPDTGVRRLILVSCLTLFLSHSLFAEPHLNLIFLLPANNSDAAANFTAPAIVAALNRIRTYSILSKKINITWVVKESQCSPTLTAENFQAEYSDDNETVYAMFGGFCPAVCSILTTLSDALNVSYVGVGCNVDSSKEGTNARPPTFVTMSFWRPVLAPLFNFVMEHFNWTRVAVLATSDQHSCYYGRTIIDSVESHNNTAIFFLYTLNKSEVSKPLTTEQHEEVDRILDEMKKHARVFIFAMDADVAARILIVAHNKGMYSGEYAFIGSFLDWVTARRIGATEKEWQSVRDGLITLEPLQSEEDDLFISVVNDVPRDKHPELSWITLEFLTDKHKWEEELAKDLFAAVMLFAYAVNRTLAKSNETSPSLLSLQQNFLIMEKARKFTYTGAHDEVSFDKSGLRQSDWTVMNLKKNGETRILMHYVKGSKMPRTAPNVTVTWPGGEQKVPKDHPDCGWDNDKCPHPIELILTILCSILGILAIIGGFLAFFLSRRMKKSIERRTLKEWQVKWSRVAVIGDNILGRFSTHDAIQSKMSFDVSSQVDVAESRSASRSAHYKLFTLAGIYKGKTVAIKKIQRESVDIYHPAFYNELNCST